MSAQIRSAALSIPGNIAEAFGRHHKKDKQNFYFYSRGSANETKSHFLCAVEIGYFSNEEIILVDKLCNEVIEELNKIIKSLD